MPVDAGRRTDQESCPEQLGKEWDGLDGLVRSSPAPSEALEGDFLTPRAAKIPDLPGGQCVQPLARCSTPDDGRNGSLLTLTSTWRGAHHAQRTSASGLASLEAADRYMVVSGP